MDQPVPIPGELPADLPKPELEETKNKTNVWFKSLSSLFFFLVIGYFFFNKDWQLVVILTIVVIIHELGHFFAMKFYKYQDLGIFFIPVMGAYASGKKQEVSQTQSAVILLAGPVPGIILGVILQLIAVHADLNFYTEHIINPRILEQASSIFIFLNVLNLLPVYPLDGGQLLHRLFLDDRNMLGKIFVILSVALMSWLALWLLYNTGNPRLLLLLFFPFMMLSRMISDIQHERLVKKVEAEGIDLMKTYDEISAEEYWKIRNVLIKHFPQLKEVNPSPPYDISPKEDQVIQIIQGLLQRSLVQDLSLTGKFLILLIWTGCFALPFIIKNPFLYF
jgi:Zn-dependent protease